MKRLPGAIRALLVRLFGRRPAPQPFPLSPGRAEEERLLLEEYRRKLAEKAQRGTLS